jgi:hypothetical protein
MRRWRPRNVVDVRRSVSPIPNKSDPNLGVQGNWLARIASRNLISVNVRHRSIRNKDEGICGRGWRCLLAVASKSDAARTLEPLIAVLDKNDVVYALDRCIGAGCCGWSPTVIARKAAFPDSQSSSIGPTTARLGSKAGRAAPPGDVSGNSLISRTSTLSLGR